MPDPIATAGVLRCRLALLPEPTEGEPQWLTDRRIDLETRIADLEAQIPAEDARLPYRDE